MLDIPVGLAQIHAERIASDHFYPDISGDALVAEWNGMNIAVHILQGKGNAYITSSWPPVFYKRVSPKADESDTSSLIR